MSAPDSLLAELSHVIANRETYINKTDKRIENLKNELADDNLTQEEKFNLYNKLYFEYRSFKFDSAFTYALKLQEIAHKLPDPTHTTYANLKLSFTMLSSGMFKETLDSLNAINLAGAPDSMKIDYYGLKARAYYDLASYNMDNYFAERYISQGNMLMDSALVLSEKNSLEYYSLVGLKLLKEQNFEKAKRIFHLILDKFELSEHDFAIAAASLAVAYKETGKTDKAIEFMTRAAIADIKSSTTEAMALMTLAEYLYNNGEETLAYDYIKQALHDATFYGARQRKIQVAAILPIIEGERLATVEGQRRTLFVYAIAVTLLSVLVILFTIIIFRQLSQLREAKRTVTEANNNLQEMNERLMEANKIKEEYIGHSFNVYSDYLDKIEKFKKSIDKKLMARKFDEINHVMKSINLKKEREALYLSFDKIFIKLFPNFVPVFNSYFNEEDRITIKDNESLNIELRIFALLRIGIHDHEQIARILEYSVSTIYNYKTKVRNRSILPNEEFEKRIMEIKAF
ncbi:tetratricopeptide repeat protein [Pontibacter qinzhouensis]|uniref:Tetratricopeptide repeat protein n=1 Tax=Pontibacter qinzhouensis TaxID=2603253 RepID=A0A5C8KAV8_9BACT|nr:DUF6377 domain-containing protein [Pontibacter qinzhouensis]TXK46107.1 tetratricopeptide repeat protein [Pontibacter qinzhouensis]